MPPDQRIEEIRYYGVGRVPLATTALRALDASSWVGDRIAGKLGEYGFTLAPRARLFYWLVPAPPFGQLEILSPPGCIWHRVVCNVDPAAVSALSSRGRDELLAELTFRGLRALAGTPADLELLDRVRGELADKHEDLAVEHLCKETKSYKVRIVYRMHPMKQGPLAPIRPANRYFATIELEDKLSGASGSQRVLDFDQHEHLCRTIATVTIKGDVISLKPRPGRNHGVAILVSRAALLSRGIERQGPT